MNFGRFTDATVELAVDLVNTLDMEGDDLQTVAELGAFLHEHGWASPAGLKDADLAKARDARAALRGVFESEDPSEVATILNRLAQNAGVTPHLTDHDGEPWHLHFVPQSSPVVERLVGTCAAALMLMSDEQDGERLGVCAADDCRWVYVDTSKNRSRRHCGEGCQTRERVRAFRRRKAGQDSA